MPFYSDSCYLASFITSTMPPLCLVSFFCSDRLANDRMLSYLLASVLLLKISPYSADKDHSDSTSTAYDQHSLAHAFTPMPMQALQVMQEQRLVCREEAVSWWRHVGHFSFLISSLSARVASSQGPSGSCTRQDMPSQLPMGRFFITEMQICEANFFAMLSQCHAVCASALRGLVAASSQASTALIW